MTPAKFKWCGLGSTIGWGIFYLVAFTIILPFSWGLILVIPWRYATGELPWIQAWWFFGLTTGSSWIFMKSKKLFSGEVLAYHTEFRLSDISKNMFMLGPGFHIFPFWWKMDGLTAHEKNAVIKVPNREVKIKDRTESVGVTLETFGADNLNLESRGATLTMRPTQEYARYLRRLGNNMTDIKKELEEQILPELLKVMAKVIASDKWNTDQIMKEPDVLASWVAYELNQLHNFPVEFGVEIFSFSFGDLGFSDEINRSREQRVSIQMLRDSVAGMTPEERKALDRALAASGNAKLEVTAFELDTSGMDPETVKAIGEAAKAIVAYKGGKK